MHSKDYWNLQVRVSNNKNVCTISECYVASIV